MHIRLRHKKTGTWLRVLDKPHKHSNSSGQLMVVTTTNYVESSLWQVAAGSKSGELFTSGQNVTRSQEIQLRQIPGGRSVHSHGDRLGYTQELAHQEVTVSAGPPDYNDDWNIEPARGQLWFFNQPVRLIHKASGKRLHSHGRSHPEFTYGFQEVTAFSGRNDNDLWFAERDGGSNDQAVLDEAESQDAAAPIGYRLNLARSAPEDEACLRAEHYASALAHFFREETHDELCFAIYGHWGRGKTYLMGLLQRLLETTDREHPAPTKVVFFQAWKYPTTPEVWVHLYETLAHAAQTQSNLLSFARNMRVGIARAGLWPLFLALCALAFAVTPKFAATELLWTVLSPLFGVGGLIWAISMAMGIRATTHRLWRDYLSATRHDENLGLQATIGKDLKALLQGWLPGERHPFTKWFYLGAAAIVGVMVWSTIHWFDFAAQYSPPSTVVKALFVVAVLIGASITILLIVFCRKAPAKVLLVVDDLDRCALPHLLHIIESIKLLVEDPEVRSRLQIAMLVEEQVLRAAILEKYRDLWDSERKLAVTPKRAAARAEDVVSENLEKLFSAHLRLEPLTDDDVRDLIYGFGAGASFRAEVSRERGRQRDSGGVEQSPPDMPVGPGLTTDNSQAADQNTKPATTPPRRKRENVALTDDEKDAIWDAVRELGFDDKHHAWGPRAVRALAFRFQLARLILNELHIAVGPSRLAKLLVGLAVNPDETSDPEPVVLLVARQVS